MPGWKFFMATPSKLLMRSLRRYSLTPCPRGGTHDASAVIDVGAPEGTFEEVTTCFVTREFEKDPRWPVTCGCGSVFLETDSWQISVERLYQGAPDGKLYTLRDLPVGAVWDAPWLVDADGRHGADGRSIVIKLPGNLDFPADGPSSEGGHWTRTGTPPLLTIHPSINCKGLFHGHVTEGVVTEDCEGRTYPGLPRTA